MAIGAQAISTPRGQHMARGPAPVTQSGAMRQPKEPSAQALSRPRVGRSDPDTSLVARVGQGDQRAARELVNRHLPRIMGLARRVLGNQADAEEVAQEVFLRVWREAPKWSPGAARFETWMHRVALNLCYDRLRKKREVTGEDIPEPPDQSPGPGEVLHRKEVAAKVDAALQALPERQRAALVLCHHQGFSNIEAAEMMETSVEAVESLLARGRRRLKELLRHEVNELLGGLDE